MIVIGEYLRPNTSHGAGIVLADGIVGTKGKLRTLGEWNLERVIAFGLATEGAGDPAKEIIKVQGLVTLIYNDKIGFLAHTIKQESVLDHRLYTRLDAKSVKQLA